ncbi:hypothetical protein [Niabella ginsengisoli]|uniref:Uncharacterized protein n=1 Tax=Niabella ginsengisoli TaxID=522298 RepID=A0ABS9SFA0_9BACT|nr:hypothetical protein [Niabella ginsengisoli]MCH5596839.1 hypothetical protein [Niabella ginsengisoli]
MKKFKLTTLWTGALFSAVIMLALSCSKENPENPVLNESVLTSESWKVDEAIGVYGGTSLKYKRGADDNNWNRDADYFVFNKDNTGYVNDGNNARHEILRWDLKKTENKILIEMMIYQNVGGVGYTDLVTWDNIIYRNGKLQYSEYYTDSYTSSNFHAQVVRSPK